MKKYKYELRNATGAVCCASDYPDFPRCGKCSAAVAAPPAQPRTAIAPALEKRTLAEWRQYIADIVSPRLEAPDAYRTARLAAPREPEPTDDPAYNPYGVPPNPYDLALASRKLAKETR